ncbi:MAG TPA: molybdopterin-dependent oxidoreductase [Thermodesulfobacteriota bacterium]|nr:molybdopterin-dependent oxidoreductase [Thermodesulfobacteriota bacterium]
MADNSRRKFLAKVSFILGGLVMASEPFFSFWAKAWGQVKRRILEPGTDRNSLIYERPKDLDARNLEITPVSDFGVMGLSDHKVDLSRWRLKVEGWVSKPLDLDYTQIRGLPAIERKVLLICPGYFVNQGLWKGISIKTILERAGLKDGAQTVVISGPEGDYSKPEAFPMEEIRSDRIFLAYGVNGDDLPLKHGFPLRLVAEDYNGSTWVKFVDSIRVEKI